jgi:Cu/Ag efflux protein CusF
MRKFLFAAASVGLITATNAYAAEATGTVRSVNTKSDSITLSDGKVYVLPEGIEAESIKVGERVNITFSQSKGKNRASAVEKAK